MYEAPLDQVLDAKAGDAYEEKQRQDSKCENTIRYHSTTCIHGHATCNSSASTFSVRLFQYDGFTARAHRHGWFLDWV